MSSRYSSQSSYSPTRHGSSLGRSRSTSTIKKGNLSTDEDTALSDMHRKVSVCACVYMCVCVCCVCNAHIRLCKVFLAVQILLKFDFSCLYDLRQGIPWTPLCTQIFPNQYVQCVCV